MDRIVEVYAGAYASGKSETAINRALQWAKKSKPITLVDLDTVEPAYTLRPLVQTLGDKGVKVITQESRFGLGESGNYVTPAQLNCFSKPGDMIIDVGYGAAGLDILDVLNDIGKEKNLQIYIVINTSKFETSSAENIVEYITFSEGLEKRPWKKFSGIISNTHFGSETKKEDIIKGYLITKEASEMLNIPIFSIGIPDYLQKEFNKTYDGKDIWVYERMMPQAFW